MSGSTYSLAFADRGSLLNRLHPLVKVACVFTAALSLFFFKDLLSGAMLFGALLAIALFAGKIPPRQILGSGRIIFLLGLLLMGFHFFMDPGKEVYRLGFLSITDVGLRQGPVFFFRLSAVVLASFILIWTTDTRDLMIALARAGIPYRIAFAVFLALRFLPLIQREMEAVKTAHAIRGRAVKSGFSHRFRLWRRYMFTILVNGLRKAESVSVSLETRAFGASDKRTYMKETTFSRYGWIALALTLSFTAALVVREFI